MTDWTHWRGLVADLLRDRDVVYAMGPIAGIAAAAEGVLELGARRVFLLGERLGTTDPTALPDQARTPWRVVGAPSSDAMAGIRSFDAGLRALPPEVATALDAWDPDRAALVLASFVTDAPAVGGRPRYAPRLDAWRALEDKVVIDACWDAWGVKRAPSAVVPATTTALLAAHRALDAGRGCVWSGDAREGFNGGASYLRWVRDPAQAEAALAFFAAHCDRVRVAPFLEGIPCAIHGVVFPEVVATFRPAEMMVLRRSDRDRFMYAGASTYWDPPERDRAEMRALARRVGAALRAEVGYRGAFTIDGILTAEGFMPTELNTRFGAAMRLLTQGAADLPFSLLCDRVRHGDALDYRPELLEALVTDAADTHRAGGAWARLAASRDGVAAVDLVWTGQGYRRAQLGEAPHARLTWRPDQVGSFVRFDPDPDHTPKGPSLAPRARAAFAAADRLLGTNFGPLEAAQAVRR